MAKSAKMARKPLHFYLNLFNRKERNLLIRDALGDRHAKLAISDEYIKRIIDRLKIEQPSKHEVHWWTDYHVDWIVGALTFFAEPDRLEEEQALTSLDTRPTSSLLRNTRANDPGGKLISGSQEDADLVISYDHTIILIEAKAYGSFTKKQIDSKAKRLASIKNYYDALQKSGVPAVEIHSILTSPRRPGHLSLDARDVSDGVKGAAKIAWMHLYIDGVQNKFRVTRCDRRGLRSSKGNFWRCVRSIRYLNLDYDARGDA